MIIAGKHPFHNSTSSPNPPPSNDLIVIENLILFAVRIIISHRALIINEKRNGCIINKIASSFHHLLQMAEYNMNDVCVCVCPPVNNLQIADIIVKQVQITALQDVHDSKMLLTLLQKSTF